MVCYELLLVKSSICSNYFLNLDFIANQLLRQVRDISRLEKSTFDELVASLTEVQYGHILPGGFISARILIHR
jgi:hypothetical protein